MRKQHTAVSVDSMTDKRKYTKPQAMVVRMDSIEALAASKEMDLEPEEYIESSEEFL